jgi:trigger factor
MYANAIKNVNKEVSVPGFRKGKAPEQYIKANFDKAIQNEWQDLVVNFAFSKSVDLTNTQPRSREAVESVKVNTLTKDDNSDIVVKFESFSTVPEFKITDLHLTKTTVDEVTEEEIDKALHNVLLSHATWEDLPEKAIESGDWIILDIDGTVDEKTFQIARDAKAQALREQMNPWIIDLIIGKKAGDTVEGMNKQDDANPEPDFVPTLCKITIKTVQKPILPELNAELAEKVKLANIDEIRPRIKESIEHSKKEEQKDKYHDAIIKQIHQKYVFEIPSSFVEAEIKYAVNEEIKKLRKQKLSEEDLKSKAEAFEEKVRKDIENSYRLLILAQTLAKKHQINVSQQEVIGELINKLQSDPNFGRGMESMNEEGISKMKEQVHTEKLVTKVLDKILEDLLSA